MHTIYTIGHSTRPIEEFISILKAYNITRLVDIRTIPKSRRNPQYGQESLKQSLEEAGIEYLHMKDLGGLRPAVKNSVNDGWRNQSFRNYADYMQTEDFKDAVGQLCEISKSKVTAIMCAEAVPWRCHRRLVGDALLVRGVRVYDIFDENKVQAHSLTPFAVTDGAKITYPAPKRDEEE